MSYPTKMGQLSDYEWSEIKKEVILSLSKRSDAVFYKETSDFINFSIKPPYPFSLSISRIANNYIVIQGYVENPEHTEGELIDYFEKIVSDMDIEIDDEGDIDIKVRYGGDFDKHSFINRLSDFINQMRDANMLFGDRNYQEKVGEFLYKNS